MNLFHRDRDRVQELSQGGCHIQTDTFGGPFEVKMQVAAGSHRRMFLTNDGREIRQLLWKRRRKTEPPPSVKPDSHHTTRRRKGKSDLARIIQVDNKCTDPLKHCSNLLILFKIPDEEDRVLTGIIQHVLGLWVHILTMYILTCTPRIYAFLLKVGPFSNQ